MMNESDNDPEQPELEKSDQVQQSSDIKAIIGPSIVITGDISGREDVIINGSVEGTIDFRENTVLIGETGRVNANVVAKTISVVGEVKGELRASDQVTITPSGKLTGDIRAPRVVLSDGCQFKGSVDMDEKPPSQSSNDMRNSRLQLKGAKPIPNTGPIRKV